MVALKRLRVLCLIRPTNLCKKRWAHDPLRDQNPGPVARGNYSVECSPAGRVREMGREDPPRGPNAFGYQTQPVVPPPTAYKIRENPSSALGGQTQGVHPQRYPHQVWLPPTHDRRHEPDVPPTSHHPPQGSSSLDVWHRDLGESIEQLKDRPRNRDTPQVYPTRNVQGPVNDNTYHYPQPTANQSDQEQIDLTRFIHDKGRWATSTGGFSDVWKCVLYTGGDSRRREQVAVKSIRLPATDHSEQDINKIIHRFRGQINMWVRLRTHKHVLPLYGLVNNFGPLPSLVSPWAENGTLNSYLRRQAGPPSYSKKITLILQVASGLQHLHDHGICHGELTGSNTLINENEDALISDFGLSSLLAEFNYTTYFGSCRPSAVRWIDPELIISLARPEGSNSRLSTKADLRHDVYSMGCIILQVCLHSMNVCKHAYRH
ncbi:kinase-like domain-containing protein [Scleroderma citrinum]